MSSGAASASATATATATATASSGSGSDQKNQSTASPLAALSGDELVASISSVQPALRDVHDAVAFAVHTLMRSAGWSCVALNEKTDEKQYKDLGAVPAGWNASSDAYCFVYTRASGSGSGSAAVRAVVKLVRMENVLVVHAIAKNDGKKVHSAELTVDDYADAAADWKNVKYSAVYKPAIPSLISLIDASVVSKVAPPALPPSAAAPATAAASAAAPATVKKPPPSDPAPAPNPLGGMPPMRPMLPGMGDFDSDWQPGVVQPPFGGGGAGGFGGIGGGGGNLLGPNHPLFDGRAGRGGGGLGPFGGGGLGVGRGRGIGPRFDPFGPMPGMGEPDATHFRKPGPRGPFGGGGPPDII